MPQVGNQKPPHLNKNWRSTGSKCTICNHQDVDAINRHLILKTLSMRTGIPQKYGVRRDAVANHNKKHMTTMIRREIVAQAFEDKKLKSLQRTDDSIEEITFDSRAAFSNLTGRVDRVLKVLEAKLDKDGGQDFDVNAFVKVAAELRKANETTAKLVGDLTNTTKQIVVLSSDPAWLKVRDVLWRFITSEAPDVRQRFVAAMRGVDRFDMIEEKVKVRRSQVMNGFHAEAGKSHAPSTLSKAPATSRHNR